MRHIILAFALLFVSSVVAQDKYLTKTGTVVFEASVPSFEEVKAKNKNTTAILNTENGEFAALVLVKGFRFKNALMEEHFNENYAESDDFPKASFKGKITDFSFEKLTEAKMEYSGSLTFHGETKMLKDQTMRISKTRDGKIIMSGTVLVNVSDFNIDIPSVVSKKLSKAVEVYFSFELVKK